MIAPVRNNTRLRRQMRMASQAVRQLEASADITVTDVQVGDGAPRLHVLMQPTARPLPGTTYKRSRCDIGMREARTAHVFGCHIDWEIA